jgi:hypothetical protein
MMTRERQQWWGGSQLQSRSLWSWSLWFSIMTVLDCNHSGCNDAQLQWCWVAMLLNRVRYIAMCLQHHEPLSSKIIDRMGCPILALVPVLDQCQFGVTRLLSTLQTKNTCSPPLHPRTDRG